ncbi:MLP-like protein 28 [Gastrolobium bilobum]|uniref:MLP-like protein 28 n=1 Tax=Gastrolobium bilobum TaxID=150636 RepID=UPI002AAF5CF9|nr:MLP-like protein 28 [Gastrolobium bilobum]
MALIGKLSVETGGHSSADKFYNLFAKQLHQLQNLCEGVHGTKLHQGDWHSIGSEKHWTYTIDGKVTTCKEKIESIDERNKTNKYILYDGEIDQNYKIFRLILQVIARNDGGAIVKWTVEYEKTNEDVDPPFGYMEYFAKITKDVDVHLLKA